MALKCDRCGTSDFQPPGKAFDLAIGCEACGAIMCGPCAGRNSQAGIDVLCCFQCGTQGIRDVLCDYPEVVPNCHPPQ